MECVDRPLCVAQSVNKCLRAGADAFTLIHGRAAEVETPRKRRFQSIDAGQRRPRDQSLCRVQSK